MSEDTLEYPSKTKPVAEEDRQHLEDNLAALAEGVERPFPMTDLIKIGAIITEQQKDNITDPLTGLHNRRWIMEKLGAVINEAERKGFTFYLVMADFDNFGEVNKIYDHVGGDKGLQMMAGLPTREGEAFSRYGGDEFLAIVSPEREKELITMADRLGEAISIQSDEVFKNMPTLTDKEPMRVGISLGIARYQQGDTSEELIKRSSSAAMEAKNKGRGTAVLSRKLSSGETRMIEIGRKTQLDKLNSAA